VKAALGALGIPFVINPRLVRGLDYYTKTAFEVTCESLDGAIKVIGGGGRYDGLVEQIGGPSTAAVGFGSGIERVILALESQGIRLAEPRPAHAAVLYFDDGAKLEALALAASLREAGVETDFPYRSRGVSKQLQAAVKSGVRFVLIVGGEEGARGEVVVKDLVNRTQEAVAKERVLEVVQRG
jgi:histidyl-tRNA synthetase